MKLIQPLLAISLLFFTYTSYAVDPVYTGFFSSTAVKGYDTVAYFTENKAVQGSGEFQTEYKGAIWLFSSKQNLELFKANPEKYEPQYGGYCAYAVAHNKTASIEPEQFTILDGKLYLNYNTAVNKKWLKDTQNFIQQADANWAELLAD